jgi:5-formyltetrahydrofolate cyclo-ligase
MTVNRESPLPAYYQIAMDLHQRISRGEWRAGGKLPSEPQLASQYKVSRMTLRQAVSELVKQGILTRRQGDGTYVSRAYLDITYRPQDEPVTGNDTSASKAVMRQQVWEKMRQVAYPDSRFHWNFEEFVPDFAGSDLCAQSIRQLNCYQSGRLLFVAPDNSLAKIRQFAIEDQKALIVATYGIRRGFYYIEPGSVPSGQEPFCATLDGMERFSRPISLDEIQGLGKIDLLITGTSLVTERGVRWGKGHGYFDLEWAIFCELGMVDGKVPVIAVGHELQVVPADLKPSPVDTIADIIVTPTRVTYVPPVYPKPEGILWDYVSPELLNRTPPLQALYERRREYLQKSSSMEIES